MEPRKAPATRLLLLFSPSATRLCRTPAASGPRIARRRAPGRKRGRTGIDGALEAPGVRLPVGSESSVGLGWWALVAEPVVGAAGGAAVVLVGEAAGAPGFDVVD